MSTGSPQQHPATLRRVPRRAFEAAIGILAKGKFLIERSYQVGEGGMMVSSSRKLEPGQSIVLNFMMNATTMIMVRGVVRTEIPAKGNSPVRYNIEFNNLEFQYKRAIRNFVADATHAEGANAVNTFY